MGERGYCGMYVRARLRSASWKRENCTDFNYPSNFFIRSEMYYTLNIYCTVRYLLYK